jgi:SAM-dependent methyltransferase
MPEAYDRLLAPAVFRPFAEDLAERAARLRPARVLELAAGTGVLTSELVEAVPEADVVATDLNGAMVEFGSGVVPGATWHQADALDLQFDDDEFDLVVCQFGVMFFADKPVAFREARRVLRPDGRFLFNTWATIDKHGFAAPLLVGIERVFRGDPPTFLAAIPYGYPDLERVGADLVAGGLERVSVETVTLEGQVSAAADIAAGFCTGTPLRMAIESRGDLAASTAAISEEMTNLLGADPITAQMTAYVVEARPSA